ncbi:MAG TPA: glycosyltransferase family 4 protein [Anaerolineae bacterium]|nr:glycosyltransferase family 4 protein [Anaerolineae bacterium]
MKIVFMITASLESPAGLRYLPMARALVGCGHQVTLLALHHDLRRRTPRRFERDGVEVRYMGQMNVRKVGSEKTYFSTPALLRVTLASTVRMLVEAARLPCDLVHVGKPQPVNGLAALLGARLLRGRDLYLDCDDYEAESNRFAHAWLRRTVILFEDGLPRFATGLTVNTRFAQERYAGLGVPPARIAYVPNGIDQERFAPPAPDQVEALRRRWGLEGRPVVGYVGSLSLTGHAVDLLLEAFAQLLPRHPEAVLLLVGGGEDRERLQGQAASLGLEGATRFAGWVPDGAIPAAISLATCTVDPVRDDLVARARAPLKIVESLAMGIPVVTGDVGDRRETLAAGQAGILVEPGSPQALADGLDRLLADEDLAASLSEGACRQRERYYWPSLAPEIVRLYETAPGIVKGRRD